MALSSVSRFMAIWAGKQFELKGWTALTEAESKEILRQFDVPVVAEFQDHSYNK